jgi:hypothetical protein
MTPARKWLLERKAIRSVESKLKPVKPIKVEEFLPGESVADFQARIRAKYENGGERVREPGCDDDEVIE